MYLLLLIKCFLLILLSSTVSGKKHLCNLLPKEKEAVFNARKIISNRDKVVSSTKPLLCVTFISLENKKSVQNAKENIRYSNGKCEWLLVSYTDFNSDTQFDELRENSGIEATAPKGSTQVRIVRPFNGTRGNYYRGVIVKPVMIVFLLPFIKSYSKVWLLDEDISITGFNFDSYFSAWNCMFDKSFPPPAITQPLVENSFLPPFRATCWTMFNNSIMGFKYSWIEQQSPILDSTFLSWYIESFLSAVLETYVETKSDMGYQMLWCGAAKLWNSVLSDTFHDSLEDLEHPKNPPCAVVVADTRVLHKDYRTIVEWHSKKRDFIHHGITAMSKIKSFFRNFYNDAYFDTSFMDSENWYYRHSGTCNAAEFLGNVTTQIGVYSSDTINSFKDSSCKIIGYKEKRCQAHWNSTHNMN